MGDGVQRCAYCGTELTDGISVCPHCGRDNSVPVLGGKKRRASSGRKSTKASPGDDYYDDRDQWASRREKRRGAAYFEEARGIEEQDYYDGFGSDSDQAGYAYDSNGGRTQEKSDRTYGTNDRSDRNRGRAGSSAGRNTGDSGTASAGSSTKRQDSIDPVDPSGAAARTEVRAKKRQDDKKKKAGIVPVLALAIIPIIVLCILIPLIVKRLPDPSLGGTLPFMQEPGEKEEKKSRKHPLRKTESRRRTPGWQSLWKRFRKRLR